MSESKQINQTKLFEISLISRLVFIIFLLVFVTTGLTALWLLNANSNSQPLISIVTISGLISGIGLLLMAYFSWRHFSTFCLDINQWANHLIKGDLSSRMVVEGKTTSGEIRSLINKISDDYQSLSIFEQQRFTRQAERIEQKKYYLGVLYDVSRTINKSNNLEDLLQRFLHTLTSVVKAKAATVRLLDKDDQMRLVASIGLSDEIIELEDTMPSPDCLCGVALKDARVMINSNVEKCGLIVGKQFFDDEEDIEMLAIPLQYRDKTLGVYNLFVHRKEHDFLEGEHELLVSIGQHLGMAIEQAGVEEDARTLSIIEERTRMAHELHDSLAQTLATLRIKVRLFDDSMHQADKIDESTIWHELSGLEEIIDNAYAELRSLITHFRAPIDGKGVVRSVERLSERFKLETDIEVFFYHNWELKNLDRDIEIDVIRIVQEALANVKKHAQADNVRILMISTEDGHCSVLVEDDGIGIDETMVESENKPDNHIGLSVMRERAARINGEIQYDDDDGEGTLVQLNFEIPMNHDSVSINNLN
ncbi:MAG: GAF domain-containing protein [Cocleimonas sp.]